jgi:hypothetical protein
VEASNVSSLCHKLLNNNEKPPFEESRLEKSEKKQHTNYSRSGFDEEPTSSHASMSAHTVFEKAVSKSPMRDTSENDLLYKEILTLIFSATLLRIIALITKL